MLARERFVDILGPLYSLMQREKSPAVVTQRLMRLQTKVQHPHFTNRCLGRHLVWQACCPTSAENTGVSDSA